MIRAVRIHLSIVPSSFLSGDVRRPATPCVFYIFPLDSSPLGKNYVSCLCLRLEAEYKARRERDDLKASESFTVVLCP